VLDSEPDKRDARCWLAYGSVVSSIPEVGAVCGKAARTVLCGGRAMKRASLPLRVQVTIKKGWILVGISGLTITASFADTIDASTRCPVAIQAFDSEKRA